MSLCPLPSPKDTLTRGKTYSIIMPTLLLTTNYNDKCQTANPAETPTIYILRLSFQLFINFHSFRSLFFFHFHLLLGN